jgi:hypothetical protein
MDDVRSGRLTAKEANQISRAAMDGLRVLEADMKSRMIEARLVRSSAPQIQESRTNAD